MSEGVMRQRIDIHQFVSLTATAPAKLYGLYPQKGTISPGSDADLVIWNTNMEFELTNNLLHHNVDYTPYEGINMRAWPHIVMSRGDIVARDGHCLAEPGRGKFLVSATRFSSERRHQGIA